MSARQKYAVLCLAMTAMLTHADEPKTASDAEVQAFLATPGVIVFMTHDPGHWRSTRRYIEVGKPIHDGCQFSNDQTMSGKHVVIQMQMARDDTTCRSLMFEGIDPDDTTQSWLKRLLDNGTGTKQIAPAPPPRTIHLGQPR